jgi:hypothetical protein
MIGIETAAEIVMNSVTSAAAGGIAIVIVMIDGIAATGMTGNFVTATAMTGGVTETDGTATTAIGTVTTIATSASISATGYPDSYGRSQRLVALSSKTVAQCAMGLVGSQPLHLR